MVFTFLENTLNQGIITSVSPDSKLALKFLSSHSRQKEITHPFRQHFFENLFLPTVERCGGNYNLPYQISIRKHEYHLEYYIIYILYDL